MFSNSLCRRVFSYIFLFFLFLTAPVFSQNTNISGVVNSYTPVTIIANCSIGVLDASAFSVGNRVMIIQMKGASVDTTSNTTNFGDVLNLNSCGNYEFCHVSSIVGNTIYLTAPLLRSYDATGTVQLIKVPQYVNATVVAPITCPNWNGSLGGVIVLECSGTLTLNDSIVAKGKGFVLGNVSPTGYSCPGSFNFYYPSTSYFGAEKGEGLSVLGLDKRNGMGKRANGGGGGNNVNAGGGGGANFGGGGNGGYSWEGCPIMDIGGRGGQALSYTNTLNKIFLGGGGGGGQQNNLQATPGTNGGGAVIIRANTINGNGKTIDASTFNVLTGGCDGTGGGGGGGTVLLDVVNYSGTLNVNVKGGDGAFPTCYQQGASGGGGGGCVWSKTALPNNVSFDVSAGLKGVHGVGSQDGLPGDTLSGLTIVGTPFTFVPLPITLNLNDSVCFGYSTTLTTSPNGIGYTFNWIPAATLSDPTINNPIAQPMATTTYSVTLTDPNGCVTSSNTTIVVNPRPQAAFRSTTVCVGNATQLTDSSSTSVGTITNWIWNFGDGSSLNTMQSPIHPYALAGNYNVKLIVNNNFGCIDSITKPVHVHYQPIVGFTHADVCFRDTVFFSDTSSVVPPASITSYLWAFGDGSSTSNLQNPRHYYSSAGTYSVTLVVTTSDGCSNVTNIPVNIYAAPHSSFTFNNNCFSDSSLFVNSSQNPQQGTISSWSWNFGDTSPLQTTVWNPSHLYTSAGNYSITLITHSSNLGCADTLKDTIMVYPKPIANFGFTDVCLNQASNFYDSTTVSNGNITAWAWDFSEGPPSVVQHPSHTYANSGMYSISLISTTNNGCKDTITKNEIVHPLPNVLFNTTNVCEGNTSSYTDFSAISANPTNDVIQSWSWNFGDSTSAAIQNPSHLYAAAGSYSVQLLVASSFGCAKSANKTVVVNPNPTVSFTAADTLGCEPLCTLFHNLSSIVSGQNAYGLWYFGDGDSVSSLQDVLHCYINDSVSLPVSYTPVLKITSDSGCVSTGLKNNYITVFPKPEARFTVQPGITTIANPVISITNVSIGGNFWNWNFGDTATSFVFNPISHTYADTGVYNITLITSTLHNCIDTAYQTIIIEPNFTFFIPNAFTPDGDGINDTFTGTGTFINQFEMSIFDRWGNLIYKTDDINKPWDGKVNRGNETAERDSYVYVMKVTDFKMTKHNYRGIVTLVR
jgi:gliding motility-associated-like protein